MYTRICVQSDDLRGDSKVFVMEAACSCHARMGPPLPTSNRLKKKRAAGDGEQPVAALNTP